MWHKLPYHWRRKISEWIVRISGFFRRINLKFRYLQDDLYEFNRKANPWLHAFSILLSTAVFVSLLLPLFVDDNSAYFDLAKKVDQVLLIGFGLYLSWSGLITDTAERIWFSLFAGRVDMLTVAVAYAEKISKRNYRYPEESVMVA